MTRNVQSDRDDEMIGIRLLPTLNVGDEVEFTDNLLIKHKGIVVADTDESRAKISYHNRHYSDRGMFIIITSGQFKGEQAQGLMMSDARKIEKVTPVIVNGEAYI